jgi:hypothetical protein
MDADELIYSLINAIQDEYDESYSVSLGDIKNFNIEVNYDTHTIVLVANNDE